MSLKNLLDRLYKEVHQPEFISADPVQFLHRYKKRQDQEIAAFLAATIAWGRRDLIIKSAEKMFALMDNSPYSFVMNGDYRRLKNRNIHRTFFEDDLKYFCRGFKACYELCDTIEEIFAPVSNKLTGVSNKPTDIWEGISRFREVMARANKGLYSKHISSPGANSACKRLNLALRWLVRREGPVDLGLWQRISPASLFIPLDIHVGRSARHLGLLDRKSNDKKAVIALTEKLREFCPQDPVKYDFALFGFSNFYPVNPGVKEPAPVDQTLHAR